MTKALVIRVSDELYAAYRKYLLDTYGKTHGYQSAEIIRAIEAHINWHPSENAAVADSPVV